jgi:glycosyltransferase involved in cell wall biosynthesis
MIVKNEERVLGRCLGSVVGRVDEIVIVDTGSTDRTREIARAYGAKVIDYTPEDHPEAFYFDDESTLAPPPYTNQLVFADHAGARNISFDAATSDYILWLDADDILVGADRLQEVVKDLGAWHCAYFRYNWCRDDAGQVIGFSFRERIIRRDSGMRWVDPCHAVLSPQPSPRRIDERIVVEQIREPRSDNVASGVSYRNYKILRRQYEESKHAPDSRTLFYLAQETTVIDEDASIELYEKYLVAGGWDEERHEARIRLGRLLEEKSPSRASAHYWAAMTERPGFPDGHFGAARLAYLRKDWFACVQLSESGFALGNPLRIMPYNPDEVLLVPYRFYVHALLGLGRFVDALAACETGLRSSPTDAKLLLEKAHCEKLIAERAADACSD